MSSEGDSASCGCPEPSVVLSQEVVLGECTVGLQVFSGMGPIEVVCKSSDPVSSSR